MTVYAINDKFLWSIYYQLYIIIGWEGVSKMDKGMMKNLSFYVFGSSVIVRFLILTLRPLTRNDFIFFFAICMNAIMHLFSTSFLVISLFRILSTVCLLYLLDHELSWLYSDIPSTLWQHFIFSGLFLIYFLVLVDNSWELSWLLVLLLLFALFCQVYFTYFLTYLVHWFLLELHHSVVIDRCLMLVVHFHLRHDHHWNHI